jgi:ribosome-associated protein
MQEIGGGPAMFAVNPQIQIAEDEFHWTFARSGGPGGQNVNKVASKVLLRWNVTASPGVPEAVKVRLRALYPGQITTEGDLLITSQRWRDQPRNREDCLEKLRGMLGRAAAVPRVRKPTRATRGSKERRLAAKKLQAARKQQRRHSVDD